MSEDGRVRGILQCGLTIWPFSHTTRRGREAVKPFSLCYIIALPDVDVLTLERFLPGGYWDPDVEWRRG